MVLHSPGLDVNAFVNTTEIAFADFLKELVAVLWLEGLTLQRIVALGCGRTPHAQPGEREKQWWGAEQRTYRERHLCVIQLLPSKELGYCGQ
jgi:hypothetical protein